VKVIPFPTRPNASSVIAQARLFADRVEGGELDGVSHAVIVFATNDGLRFASWGDPLPTYAVMGMMESGKMLAFAASIPDND
jgi:hypothetical protein